MEVLGVPPGSVTPFALINDKARRVTVILDADMMRHERLNYHPLENTATTNIAREDLLGSSAPAVMSRASWPWRQQAATGPDSRGERA